MRKSARTITVLLAATLLLAGCVGPVGSGSPAASSAVQTAPGKTAPNGTAEATAEPTATPAPVPLLTAIGAVPDPSVAAADVADPYAALNRYTAAIYKPDREVYNLLYRAVDAMEPSADVSAYSLTAGQYAAVFDCLYSEAQLRFFYLAKAKLGRDGKTVQFTYTTDDTDAIQRDRETLEARLGHLLYNVAPANYTDLQKALAMYQYVCGIADYSGDASDPSTYSPYSILLKQQGICNGFANLMDYALNFVGVPTEYISNEIHAWNMVAVGGKRYLMDATFGAGQFGSATDSLNTVFMDDATRLKNLQDNGVGTDGIILGYPSEHDVKPPACTNSDLAAYNKIFYAWALDIDGNKVYYTDEVGVKRMNLDCTGVESVADGVFPNLMAFYDGILYYIGGDNNQLFKLKADGTSEPVVPDTALCYLAVADGTLRYGINYDGKDAKSLRLTAFDAKTWAGEGATEFPGLAVPRSRSFAVALTFSEPMDGTADWRQYVVLADADGNPLPAHLIWSEDGRTLTVRPKECVADMGSVAVYLKPGGPSAAGGALEGGGTAKVQIEAGK